MDNTTAELVANNGLSFHSNGEHRLVIGEKILGLKDSDAKVGITGATFQGFEEFYKARKEEIITRKAETHLIVDTTNTKLTLIVGEKGARKLVGENDVTTQYVVSAKTQRSQDFKDVLGYMKDEYESAHDFAMELRQRPELFESLDDQMRVVDYLRKTSLKVKSIREEQSTDQGLREKNLKAYIEGDQLDLTWNWFVPLFDGSAPTKIPVKAIWEIQGNMKAMLVLLDRGTILLEREAKKKLMDDAVSGFQSTIGANVVPAVYVNGTQKGVDE